MSLQQPDFPGAIACLGLRRPAFALVALAAFATACTDAPPFSAEAQATAGDHAHCDPQPPSAGDSGYGTIEAALSSISCATSTATGYKSGSAFTITVVHVDGKPVEVATANAYYVMAQSAANSGIHLKVVSGFRTMAEQQYLYNCYLTKKCNNGNLAAKPGYSNHQSGHALDLNTSSSGVFNWLVNNGGKFGFKKTVPSENWHWEWWGGGPGGGPCGGCSGGCNDGNACTNDSCQGTQCVHANNANGCNDNNGCTVNDHCQGGGCKGGGAKDCNDGNPCTNDSCSGGACQHPGNGNECNDGDPCTLGDVCKGGKCSGGGPMVCNDANPCTDDGCQGGKCGAKANSAACSDGDACTLADVCAGGSCTAGQAKSCDDGDPCVVGEACVGGDCVAGKPVVCDDGNPCTSDACAGGLCTFTANTADCSDGDACTQGDYCALGICLNGLGIVCSDGNPCTGDACDPASGCQHPPGDGKCDDGDGCTEGDYCAQGICLSGAPLACDDGLPCSEGKCNPGQGKADADSPDAGEADADGKASDATAESVGAAADNATGQDLPRAATDAGQGGDAGLGADGGGASAAAFAAQSPADSSGCTTARASDATPAGWLVLLAGLLVAVRRRVGSAAVAKGKGAA